MNMKQNLQDIFVLFSNDETLLRLLHYKPTNANDDPLNPTKPNILSMADDAKWVIIEDVIKFTPKVDDLDSVEKCRLLFYPGNRKPMGNNYLVSSQEIVIDILCHFDFENVDLRTSWICDRVNELISNKYVTGMSNLYFRDGRPIPAPKNYIGYRLMFGFGSDN